MIQTVPLIHARLFFHKRALQATMVWLISPIWAGGRREYSVIQPAPHIHACIFDLCPAGRYSVAHLWRPGQEEGGDAS